MLCSTVAEAVHAHVRAEHAARDAAAGDDAAGRDDRVERLPAAPAVVGEHELRRRRLHLVRAQRPLRIVEVEVRVDVAEIHVGVVVGVERADVAPVLRRPSCSRRRSGRRRPAPWRSSSGMMSLPKSWVVERRASASSAGTSTLHVEDVDAHRREHRVRRAAGRCGFSRKPVSRSSSSTCSTPKRLASSDGISMHAERRAGAALAVEAQHLARSPSCRRDRPTARSGGAAPRAGWSRGSGRRRRRCPRYQCSPTRFCGLRISMNSPSSSATTLQPIAEVAAERERLVLQRDEDLAQPRVDAVAEREVDDPVRPAEVDRRLGPLLGQRIQPFAHAAGQHHHETSSCTARPSAFPADAVPPRRATQRRRAAATNG